MAINGIAEQDEFRQWIGRPISHLAVNGFFFVSGMLVCQSMLRQSNVTSFAAMRIGRIWPGLMTCVCLTALAYALISGQPLQYLSEHETLRFIARNFIQIKGFYTLPALDDTDGLLVVNGSLWTIVWELRCYTALALLYLVAPRLRARAAVTVALMTLPLCLAWVVARDVMPEFPEFSPRVMYYASNTARLWGCFAAGMLVGIGWRHIVITPALLLPLWLAVIIEHHVLGTRLLVSPATFYTVLVAAFGQRGGKALSADWPDFSYGIYIYAFPVMVALQHLVGFQSHAALAAVNFSIALMLAALSWFMVEKPALAHVRQFMRARRARSAAMPPVAPTGP